MKRVRRCGACNAKFTSAIELVEHLRSNCVIASNMKSATDIIIPVIIERGISANGADKAIIDLVRKDGNS